MWNRTQSSLLVIASLAWAARAQAQSTLYVLPGDQSGDEFGSVARGLGDVDNDGTDDLIATSRNGAGGRGYARVVSGSSGVTLLAVSGAAQGDEFGAAAACVGDVDGDHHADVLIGAPGAGGTGRAFVISGANGATLRTMNGGAGGARYGSAVASLGDVNGDAIGDFAIGAPHDDVGGNDSGSVFVVSGFDGATLWSIHGPFGGYECGTSLAALGDVDGDLVRDLAVGEPYVIMANSNQPGRVRVFSGADGTTLFTRLGQAARDRFGSCVESAGDVNLDGTDDVIVGAPQPKPNAAGYARILSGATGAALLQVSGDASGDQFGSAVASAADANGDARSDVWIGAPYADFGGQDSGRIRLVDTSNGVTLATFDGNAAGARLGSALDGGCDVNADGVPDAVLAGVGSSLGGSSSGEVRVVSTHALPLVANSHLLSLATPTAFPLTIDAGAAHAGEHYMVLGSIDGALPGTLLRGAFVPLNPGRYLDYALRFVPGGVIAHQRGVLDLAGRATARFDPWRSASAAELVGYTFHHVVLLSDAAGVPTLVSNAIPVTLVP